MKTALLLLAACAISHAQIPWGLHRQGDVRLTALQQRMPPLPLASPRPARESEGVMVTVDSPDLNENVQADVSVFIGVVLDNARYVFQERTIKYDHRYPTTLYFPVGRTATLIRLKATITKTVEVN
jgi:hypothetical protein